MIKIMKRIIDWIGPYKKRLYLGFVFSFFQSVCIALPIVITANGLQLMLDDYHGKKTLDIHTIWFLLLLLILTVIGRFIFAYLKALYQESIGYEISADHRIKMGNTLKRVSLGFFHKHRVGDINSAVTTDLSFFEMMGIKMIDVVINGYILTFTMILFLLFYQPRMALVAICGVIVSFIFLRLLQRHSRNNASSHQKSQHQLVSSTLEYLRGMSVIKNFNQEGIASRNLQEAFHNSKQINIMIQKGFGAFNVGHRLALKLASVFLVLIAAYMVMNGEMELADMLLITLFSFVMFDSLEPISDATHVLETINNTLDKLESLENTTFIDEQGTDTTLTQYSIQFDQVSFSYDKRPIIQDVSFTIKEGTTTAIVGPSGSGKTTLCNLIARFYDVNNGAISIDNINIKTMQLNNLLSSISMVFQKVYLFNDTIYHNILFGNPYASQDEIIEAAKKAQCHDFIMSLEKGYDTVLNDGGSSLSGGEKQRISIARAILKNAPIIILDEATASLDPENETLIQAALDELIQGKTTIIIAHRLATIENADQIIVLEDGKIVQKGSHHSLMKEQGVYRHFINIRQGAENWKLTT
ncbi:ABC transporter ATP-binding protein [Lysinibacillus sp. UGB7]|uniref:ABC transporter ATP-binding protein n=1 Tax=Lysinibacillus sp. UGB7 TaxID=3411039 RepID=UPI003B7640D3